MKNEQRDVLRLLLAGLTCADAIGSSVEFAHQCEIPDLYEKLQKHGWPWRQAGGGPFGWRKGQSTDDGDQAMCLVRSFVRCGKFDPEDVAKELVAWLNSNPPDVGSTTARTLSAIRHGTPWHRAGLEDWKKHPNSAANGALMRNGILPAICFGEDLNELFRATTQHTIITHGHPLAVLISAINSFIIADELSEWEEGPAFDPDGWLDSFYRDWTAYVDQEDDPYVGAWLDSTRGAFQQAGDAIMEADWNPHTFNPFQIDFAGRAGFCLLTEQISVWALRWCKMDEPFPTPKGFPAEVFERRGAWTMAWFAMLGFDTDTYGSCGAPAIAAAHGSVPESMMQGLEALAEFDKLIPSTGE